MIDRLASILETEKNKEKGNCKRLKTPACWDYDDRDRRSARGEMDCRPPGKQTTGGYGTWTQNGLRSNN